MRTRIDPLSSARDITITLRNRNTSNDFIIGFLQKRKREKKNQNNHNWSDDKKDNRTTCKKYTAKLSNNTDETLCTACLIVC